MLREVFKNIVTECVSSSMDKASAIFLENVANDEWSHAYTMYESDSILNWVFENSGVDVSKLNKDVLADIDESKIDSILKSLENEI